MIRWGVIGAGNIAHRFCEALKSQKDSELYAVSCRTKEKAEAFQKGYPCAQAYGSFQEIIDDQNIDAVYVALPHLYHFEWSKKALEASKSVICEKPSMMSKQEMEQIKQLAIKHNTFFMEAMKNRCVPLYLELVKRIEAGDIGQIHTVTTSFCNLSPYVENAYHYMPGQGGCLLDIGIYNTAYLVDFLQGNYHIEMNENKLYENGIETYIHATLAFDNGTKGILETAFDCKKDNFVSIEGTKGKIVVKTLHRPEEMEIHIGTNTELVIKPYDVDDFYSQIDHACSCILEGKIESPINTFDSSIQSIEIVDKIKEEIHGSLWNNG